MNSVPQLPDRMLLLCGPTASGKSDVALELAERFDGEIISADSMQAYRGMDIGTAKPSPAERLRVPHHLLDVADITEQFDAGRFLILARQAANEIAGRGRLPIVCGGTGFYIKAFVEGLDDLPPSDPVLRAELNTLPLPLLLEELQKADPVAYQKIDRHNPRRVVRAVEVIRLTGKPFSSLRSDWSSPALHPSPALHCLLREPADLQQRINSRVDRMFASGLVNETCRLLDAGLEQNPVALQALGYRQVVKHLRQQNPLPAIIEEVKTRTRQFARRQMTWFRGQAGIKWVPIIPTATPDEIARTFACPAPFSG